MKWQYYQSPTPPFKFLIFTPINGGGGGGGMGRLCPLDMPMTVVQQGFVEGPKRGRKAIERGGGLGAGFPPSTVGRFSSLFFNSPIKNRGVMHGPPPQLATPVVAHPTEMK